MFYDEKFEKNKGLKFNIQYELTLIFIEITEEISPKNPMKYFKKIYQEY